MKILAVLCQNPFAYSDGGTYAVRASLHRLARQGELQVTGWGDDFCGESIGPYRSAGSLGRAHNSQWAFLRSLLARRSYSIDKYAYPAAQRAFRSIVEHGGFDVIWYEKLQAAGVAQRSGMLGRRPGPVHVLRAHNVEYATFRDRFDFSAGLQARLLAREARALKAAELDLIARFDLVLNITQEDRDEYLREQPAAADRLLFFPVLPDEARPSPITRTPNRRVVLFVGDCRWRPNLLAAEWIAGRLGPELQRTHPQALIRMVGQGTEVFRGRAPILQAAGFVDDIEREYESALCTLAPIWHGGGINIKVIASLAHGVPVVGSRFARRGTLTDAYLEAETPTQFVAQIGQLLDNPQRAEELGALAQHGMEELEKRFDEFWRQHFG